MTRPLPALGAERQAALKAWFAELLLHVGDPIADAARDACERAMHAAVKINDHNAALADTQEIDQETLRREREGTPCK